MSDPTTTEAVDRHDPYDPDVNPCDGNGCIVPESGMHHDKINGPHYWCAECEGCWRCEPDTKPE